MAHEALARNYILADDETIENALVHLQFEHDLRKKRREAGRTDQERMAEWQADIRHALEGLGG